MTIPVLTRIHPWAAAHRLVVVASAVVLAAAAVLAVVLASSSATAGSVPPAPVPTHSVPSPVQATPGTTRPAQPGSASDACTAVGPHHPC